MAGQNPFVSALSAMQENILKVFKGVSDQVTNLERKMEHVVKELATVKGSIESIAVHSRDQHWKHLIDSKATQYDLKCIIYDHLTGGKWTEYGLQRSEKASIVEALRVYRSAFKDASLKLIACCL